MKNKYKKLDASRRNIKNKNPTRTMCASASIAACCRGAVPKEHAMDSRGR